MSVRLTSSRTLECTKAVFECVISDENDCGREPPPPDPIPRPFAAHPLPACLAPADACLSSPCLPTLATSMLPRLHKKAAALQALLYSGCHPERSTVPPPGFGGGGEPSQDGNKASGNMRAGGSAAVGRGDSHAAYMTHRTQQVSYLVGRGWACWSARREGAADLVPSQSRYLALVLFFMYRDAAEPTLFRA